MRLYLSTPIDRNQHDLEDGNSLALKVIETWITDKPLALFSPVGAFSGAGPDSFKESEYNWIVEVNEKALHTCDAVIVWYRPGIESWGVPQEVLMAKLWIKPVFVLAEHHRFDELPIYLKGRTKRDRVFTSIEPLIGKLLQEERIGANHTPC